MTQASQHEVEPSPPTWSSAVRLATGDLIPVTTGLLHAEAMQRAEKFANECGLDVEYISARRERVGSPGS